MGLFILKPHPRKGTETYQATEHQRSDFFILKPHPRKGTETVGENFFSPVLTYFKTTSPHGDGNNHSGANSLSFVLILKPHPRKGTETRRSRPLSRILRSFQNHIPARGRKHTAQASPVRHGGGGPRSGGRGAMNDPCISIVRKPHSPQVPPLARTARHLPRFDGRGE